MSVTYSVEDSVVVFVLKGENTLEQAKKSFGKAFNNLPEEKEYSVLVDALLSDRHRDMFEVSGFAEILLLYKKQLGNKCALVINEERPKALELERRLAGYSIRENIQFGLFLELTDARKWLAE